MSPVVALLTMPLLFQPNVGQVDTSAQFYARTPTAQYFITAHGVRVGLRGAAMQLEWAGARPLHFEAQVPQPTSMSWFIGNDPKRWHAHVPTFAVLRSPGLYPGVDLVLHGDGDQLEYDLELSAHADVNRIRLAFQGVARSRLDANGDLILTVAGHELRQLRPRVWQGAKEISAQYVRRGDAWGLALSAHDTHLPLRVDPVLATSTYLGGSQSDEASAVAVDSQGNLFLVGDTTSGDFPVVGPSPSTLNGGRDVFISKLDSTARTLLYSAYFGGAADDYGNSIAVTPTGDAVISGFTLSSNLPVLNPVQANHVMFYDGFIAKLGPTGDLIFSTYLGGTNDDYATAVAVDAAGQVFVTGCTTSSDFPTANTTQTLHGSGQCDAFLTVLPPTGAPFVLSRLLGGASYSWALAMTLDASGNVYVGGRTDPTSTALPGMVGPALAGGDDAFVVRYDPAGNVVFSRFIGGSANDTVQGIAVDSAGQIIIVGDTASADFPLVNAFQGCSPDAGITTAFFLRLDATGNTLTESTCLFTGAGIAYGVALDDAGYAYVVGQTRADDAATPDGAQTVYGGGLIDAFLERISPSGQRTYGTYLGGSDNDKAVAVTLGSQGTVFIAGATASSDFPTRVPVQAQLASPAGATNAFVAAFTFPEAIFDSGVADAGVAPDAGSPDAGAFDAGTFDAGTFDAGMMDSGVPPDAGAPDAGVTPEIVRTERVGCGCSSSDSAAGVLTFVAALLAARRRRK